MYETSTQQYESRHRLTWAARYPLKPGRDVASRRGLLVQIADTAVSGQYWVTQAKLAERMGLTVRGLRMKLAKLCAEGALRARPRGFKQTTVYTLMRLDEVAEHGDFLPLDDTLSEVDRDSSSSQTTPPVDRNSSSSQNGLTGTTVPLATGTPVPPKDVISKEEIKKEVKAPPRRSDSAASYTEDAALIPTRSNQNLPYRAKPERPISAPAMRPKPNVQRNLRIIEAYEAGWSQNHLAKLFKMSQHGIGHVLQRGSAGVNHELHRTGSDG